MLLRHPFGTRKLISGMVLLVLGHERGVLYVPWTTRTFGISATVTVIIAPRTFTLRFSVYPWTITNVTIHSLLNISRLLLHPDS